MANLSVAPPSGMRDLLPLDVARRDYVINIVKRTFKLYGFQPIETPAMERLSTLQGKYGEEGEQLMYKVLKRGLKLDRAVDGTESEPELADMGLRYDLTVPLARLVAGHQHDFLPIFKRFQIQPVFRAERPAKGRYREFMQCDVDVVGLNSLDAEAEVMSAGASTLEALGFTGAEAFRMRLNHRTVLKWATGCGRGAERLAWNCTGCHRQGRQDRAGRRGKGTAESGTYQQNAPRP